MEYEGAEGEEEDCPKNSESERGDIQGIYQKIIRIICDEKCRKQGEIDDF